jgi:galactose oxidase
MQLQAIEMRGFDVPADNEQGLIRSAQQGPVGPPESAARSAAAGAAGDAEPPPASADGRFGRRTFLLAGSAAAALAGTGSLKGLLGGSSPKAAASLADPVAAGQWTAPFDLTLISIHAVLLYTGKVLLFSWPNNTVGSDAVLYDPVSGSITSIPLNYQRDIFCGGTTELADGRLFIAGGHIYQGAILPTEGVANTTLFDPASSAYTEGPTMDVARWYPTTAQLGDGTVRIFGGVMNNSNDAITVDSYDPSANTLTTLPASASKVMYIYPRMKLTTSGLLAWTNMATTYFFNPATATWAKGPRLNSGARGTRDTSVLLPGLTQIMEIGGKVSGAASKTAEILDLSASPPAWKTTASMNFARWFHNTVLLADGTVLVVGGGTNGAYGGAVLTPELYDPVSATWTQMAAQTAPRMYHSTALLLPDGRVLSAGQSHGTLQNTGEIFSPPYLFAGPRPTITSAPASIGYNQQFTITTPDFASIGRVALVKPGAVTHCNNFDQRYVDLTYQSNGSDGLTANSPPDGNHAPPGWYMLFILTSGVPSVASWVQVG